MEEQDENLMSIFGTDGLELNMDFNPADVFGDTEEEEQDDNDITQEDEESSKEQDNLDEDDSSEEVVEEEDSEGDSTDVTSPNIYSSFASVLAEEGLLPSLGLDTEKKVESLEDLTSVFKEEINNQVKSFLIERVGEKGLEALEKGVSLAEYQQHNEEIQALDSVTDDMLRNDLELSKRIIYQDYINQGIDERRAMRILNKIMDDGEDAILEDAKESLESLKLTEAKRIEKLAEEREAIRLQNIKAQEKIDNDLKNSIYNTNEFIKGIKANKAIQDRVYKSITHVVGKSPEGVAENQLMRDRRENPIEFDSKLYYLYEITKGFKDFSALKAKATTSAIKDLEKGLRQTKFHDSGAPSFIEDPESYGGIGTELNF